MLGSASASYSAVKLFSKNSNLCDHGTQWRIQELPLGGMICVGGNAEGSWNAEGYTPAD